MNLLNTMCTKSANTTFGLKLKTEWIFTMQAHQDADRIMQGDWLYKLDGPEPNPGCFFGCAMQSDERALKKAAIAMNLPYDLVYAAEELFEVLPEALALEFPVEFLNAVPTNVLISIVNITVINEYRSKIIDLLNDRYKEISLYRPGNYTKLVPGYIKMINDISVIKSDVLKYISKIK